MSENLTASQRTKIKFVSSLIGSISSVIVCCPLDLVKVRYQVSHNQKNKDYNSITKIIKNTYNKEGIKGFFSGLKTGITTSPIFYSIYFPIYENAKVFYSQYFYNNKTTQDVKVLSLSSMTAVIVSDLCTTPMWVVRVRHQTDYLYNTNGKSKENFNVFKEIKDLYKKEGFFALYRGYKVVLFGSPHVIIQFNVYEYFSKKAREFKNKTNAPYFYVLVASIVSKLCAVFINYPLEVVRNNMQSNREYGTSNQDLLKCIKSIYNKRGILGFYYGFGIGLIRVLPNNAVLFLTYEFVSRFLQSYVIHDSNVVNI